jgi:hypothetical protein
MAAPSRHAERHSSNLFLCLAHGWLIFLKTRAQLSINFKEILSDAMEMLKSKISSWGLP